jgi:hypothetical protein
MIATVIDPAGTSEPMEMSNSPAIINRPMGMAMMPKAAATFSQDAAPLNEAKFKPPKTVKKVKTAARPRNEPVSGRRINAPMEKGSVILGIPSMQIQTPAQAGCWIVVCKVSGLAREQRGRTAV